ILRSNNNWTPNWTANLRVEFFPAEGRDGAFDYFTGSAVRPISSVLQSGTLTIQFDDLAIPGKLEVHCKAPRRWGRNGVALTPGTDFTYDTTRKLLTVPFSGATTLVVHGTGSVF